MATLDSLYCISGNANPWRFPPPSIIGLCKWQPIRAYLEENREEGSLHSIRRRATEICVALQSLHLPAWITLQILDAGVSCAPDARLGAKWDLVCAVKHFHDRRAVDARSYK